MKMLLMVVLAAASGFAQMPVAVSNSKVLSVTDASPAGAPLTFSGAVNCSESPEGTKVRTVQKGSVAATNISQQDIVAVAVVIKTTCLHGGYGGHYIHDFFFKDHGLVKNATWDISVSTDEARQAYDTSDPETPLYHMGDPDTSQATAEVVFVQFEDGSIWGDKLAAANILEGRDAVLVLLQRLADASADQTEFLRILAEEQPPDSSLESVVEGLNNLQRKSGMAEAVAHVRSALKVAALRKATGVF